MPQDAPRDAPEPQQNMKEELCFAQTRFRREQERSRILDARVAPLFVAVLGLFASSMILGSRINLEDFIPAGLPSSFVDYALFFMNSFFLPVAVLLFLAAILGIINASKPANDTPDVTNPNVLQRHIDWIANSINLERESNIRKTENLQGVMYISYSLGFLLLAIILLRNFVGVIKDTSLLPWALGGFALLGALFLFVASLAVRKCFRKH